MISVLPYVTKAADALDRAQRKYQRAQDRLAEHDVARPSAEDSDANFDWRRERRDFVDRVETEQEAVDFAQRALAVKKLEAEREKAAARHAAKAREAKAAIKRVRAIFEIQAKLAAELDWLKEHVVSFDTYNREDRGPLSYVQDAEELLRKQPERHEPEVIAQVEMWLNEHGDEPRNFVERNGEMIPMGHYQWRKVKKDVVVKEGVHVFPHMPSRLAEEIVLVDQKGARLWPR